MLISLDLKFIFVANPKVAATAIEAVLRPLCDIALVESRFEKHMALPDIEQRFSWVFELVNREDFLIFGVMRDPIDLVVSIYNSYTDQKFADNPDLYTGNIDFDQFIGEWVERNRDHLLPQYTRLLTADGNIGANYIISYSNLEEGLGYVAARLGVPALCELQRFNASQQRLSRADLSPEQRAWISTHFQDDEEFISRFCDRLLTKAEQEWKRASSTDQEVVRALYRVCLRRDPDPEGLATSLELLRTGFGVEELMRWRLRSQEFGNKSREFVRTYLDPEFLDARDDDGVSPPVSNGGGPGSKQRPPRRGRVHTPALPHRPPPEGNR